MVGDYFALNLKYQGELLCPIITISFVSRFAPVCLSDHCIVPVVESYSKDIHALEGEEVSLWVRVIGTPMPMVTWLHNGKIVTSEEDEEQEGDDSQLVLQSVGPHHAGVYQFQATNTVGSVEGQIRLFVDCLKANADNDVMNGASLPFIQSNPVPVAKLAEYMTEMQPHNNIALREQYRVSC